MLAYMTLFIHGTHSEARCEAPQLLTVYIAPQSLIVYTALKHL